MEDISLAIWGTGGHAGSIINYNKVWLDNVRIVCFVSNAHKEGEGGESFYGKPVISPVELEKTSYDYILILSTYINDIKKQIKEELLIPKEKIITLEELAKKIVRKKGLSVIGKKVLLYGDDYRKHNYIYHLKMRTKSVKYITNEPRLVSGIESISLGDIENETFDYVLLLDENASISKFENMLRNKYSLDIEECKILLKKEWTVSLAYEFVIKKKNEKNYFFPLIARPNDGLMQLLIENLRMCDYAYEKGYIPFVDMQMSFNMHLADDKFEKENSWEYFFSQTESSKNRTIEDIYEHDNVVIPSMFLKMSRYRDIEKNENTRIRLKTILSKTFSIKNSVLMRINEECSNILSEISEHQTLGAIYRGTDYTTIKPANHMIQPELDEFIEMCKIKIKEWNCERIYVATEDEDALEKLKKEFGNRLLYTNQVRYKDTGGKYLANIHNMRNNDEYERGYEYLTAIYVLTKCKYLISGENGASAGALILKEGSYENMYIFDKGKYPATNNKYY